MYVYVFIQLYATNTSRWNVRKLWSEYSVGVGIGRNLRQHSESVQPLWFAQIAQASRAETLERVPGESHHHRRIPALFLYGQSANPLTILSWLLDVDWSWPMYQLYHISIVLSWLKQKCTSWNAFRSMISAEMSQIDDVHPVDCW